MCEGSYGETSRTPDGVWYTFSLAAIVTSRAKAAHLLRCHMGRNSTSFHQGDCVECVGGMTRHTKEHTQDYLSIQVPSMLSFNKAF